MCVRTWSMTRRVAAETLSSAVRGAFAREALRLCLALATTGCLGFTSAVSVPPVAATPLNAEALEHQDTSLGRLHDALRLRAVARADGWTHQAMRKSGNFLQERWCAPTVSVSACERGTMGREPEPGHAWSSLSALHYPKDWPQVFGLVYDAGAVPGADGWGASVSISLQGARVIGDHVYVRLLPVTGGVVGEVVPLGPTLSWTIEETTLRVVDPALGTTAGEDELRRWLDEVLSGPDSLRTRSLAHLDALGTKVSRALMAGEVQKCEYAEYQGDGIPPECTLVPLSAEEQRGATVALGTELARRRSSLEAGAQAMQASVRRLLVEESWATP